MTQKTFKDIQLVLLYCTTYPLTTKNYQTNTQYNYYNLILIQIALQEGTKFSKLKLLFLKKSFKKIIKFSKILMITKI